MLGIARGLATLAAATCPTPIGGRGSETDFKKCRVSYVFNLWCLTVHIHRNTHIYIYMHTHTRMCVGGGGGGTLCEVLSIPIGVFSWGFRGFRNWDVIRASTEFC